MHYPFVVVGARQCYWHWDFLFVKTHGFVNVTTGNRTSDPGQGET
jgi:hypothetical protein